MRPATQRRPEVLGEHPDVSALAASDEQLDCAPLELLQLEPPDHDRSRRAGNVLAASGVGVQGAALMFDRRMPGWKLLDLAAKTIQRCEQILARGGRFRALQHRTLRVPGLGALAELDARPVSLVGPEQRAGEFGRLAQSDDEQAARQGVERSRMAGALCAEEAFRCLQDGVRARSDRLVDKQDSIDGRLSHEEPQSPFFPLTAASISCDRRTPRSTETSCLKRSSGVTRRLRRFPSWTRRNPAARSRPASMLFKDFASAKVVKKTLA